ncbi:MAG: helicase HerA domain-containing protein [Halolamina sp.]
MASPESISVTEDERSLPVEKLLTGRGFITGKSGSGKSNTASVIVESLLEADHPLFIVDTEGEYYGLKEEYDLLHAGADDNCDVAVDEGDAAILATVVFEHEYPVVLDVSGYFDIEDAKALIERTLAELFRREKEYRKPTMLLVEEIQEYLPQQGGSDDLSKLLLRIAKRGRKRGLGMCGLSQRPSAVDKDFITQCDWMIWHRLTWETDVDLVKRILGSKVADEITDLETGEGFLMTDWDEGVEQVKFQKKETFDAGATPSIGEEYEEPEFRPVDPLVVSEFDPGKRHADTGEKTADEADDSRAETDGTAAATTGAASDGGATTMGSQSIDQIEPIDPSDGGESVSNVGQSEEAATDEGTDDADEAVEAATADLRDELERERARNEALEAELTELRALLDERANPPPRDADPDADPSTAPGDEPTSMDTWDESDPGEASSEPRAPPLDSRRQSSPDGATGIIVELSQMVAHLLRWFSGTVFRLFSRLAGAASSVGGGSRQQRPLAVGAESRGASRIGGSSSLGVQIAVVVGLLLTVGLATLAVLVVTGVVSL